VFHTVLGPLPVPQIPRLVVTYMCVTTTVKKYYFTSDDFIRSGLLIVIKQFVLKLLQGEILRGTLYHLFVTFEMMLIADFTKFYKFLPIRMRLVTESPNSPLNGHNTLLTVINGLPHISILWEGT